MKKKAKFKGFEKFWFDTFLPALEANLTEYCKSINGDIVNADPAENLLHSKLQDLQYCPLLDNCFSMRIGQKTRERFVWHYTSYENIQISGIKDIRKILG